MMSQKTWATGSGSNDAGTGLSLPRSIGSSVVNVTHCRSVDAADDDRVSRLSSSPPSCGENEYQSRKNTLAPRGSTCSRRFCSKTFDLEEEFPHFFDAAAGSSGAAEREAQGSAENNFSVSVHVSAADPAWRAGLTNSHTVIDGSRAPSKGPRHREMRRIWSEHFGSWN